MMTSMRYHPVPGAVPGKTGFGFETIMANADFSRFRRWYDSTSFFVPGRKAAEAEFGQIELDRAA